MIKPVFRQMSQEEMDIEGINDIKMIHIYDLTGASKPDGKYGVTAVLINYADNKQLNYTENDHCFGFFISKIFEMYNNCGDKDSIIMDDTTRELMEAGKVPRHDSVLSKFYDSEKLDIPRLVNASTLSKRFGPLVEYLLVGLYKTMGTDALVIDRKNGWRGSGRLIIRVGAENRTVYYKVFEINENTFSVKLNGCLTENGDLTINIILYDDELSVSYRSDSTLIEGSSSFKFGKDALREMHQIQKDGKQIFYDVNIYENLFTADSKLEDEVPASLTGLLPEGMRPSTIYSLPMGLKYLLYDELDSSDSVEVQTFCGVFLWQEAYCADIRGWSMIKSLQAGLTLKNEVFRMLNLSDNREYIQSAFLTGTGSRYKEELEGKFVIYERKCV